MNNEASATKLELDLHVKKLMCVWVGGGSRLQKSELTPIDYLGLVQMAMTSPQMGLISSEVEKPPPYGARQN